MGLKYPTLHHRARVAAQSDDYWLEIPLGDGWIAAYRLTHGAGRTRILELRVFPDDPERRLPGEWGAERLGSDVPLPGRPFSFKRLRRIVERDFDSALAAVVANTKQREGKGQAAAFARLGSPGDRHHGSDDERRGAGRPRLHSPLFYAQIAKEYDWAEHRRRRDGDSSHRVLARKHSVTTNTVAKWLTQARKLEFLTKARRGQRGSRLTPKGRELLKVG